jgi:hypothetical protein
MGNVCSKCYNTLNTAAGCGCNFSGNIKFEQPTINIVPEGPKIDTVQRIYGGFITDGPNVIRREYPWNKPHYVHSSQVDSQIVHDKLSLKQVLQSVNLLTEEDELNIIKKALVQIMDILEGK